MRAAQLTTDAKAMAKFARSPFRLVGFRLGSWAFAFRIWLAMMAALYAAFWLELSGPSSAAVTVGILALQTRGQAAQKAVYRLLGTAVGVAISIVMAGLFAQIRDLYLVAFAAWLGICVFFGSLLDGNRAYGAVLSGYTVANVAVAQIDAPLDVFLGGLNRGAAIVVGIVALALVNDTLGAPDVLPSLVAKLEALHRKVRAFAVDALRAGRVDHLAAAMLIKEVTALHPDITALPAESLAAGARGAAVRNVVAALVGEVVAVRAYVSCMAGAVTAPSDHEHLWRMLEPATSHPSPSQPNERPVATETDPGILPPPSHSAFLIEQDRLVDEGLRDLRLGRVPARRVRLPIFRSRRLAARNGVRTFLSILLCAIPLVLGNWPQTSMVLVLVGVTLALSAVNPNPTGFATNALIAMPTAVVAAGVTAFLILDGVSDFPLLAIAMAPTVIAASLVLTRPDPRSMGLGLLVLVFFPVLLAPGNPQDYNPQTYLFSSTMAITAVAILNVLLATLLPTSDARRRRDQLASARADLRAACADRKSRWSDAEAEYRAADRIGQFVGPGTAGSREQMADLHRLMHMSDLTTAVRRARSALSRLAGNAASAQASIVGREGLASLDPRPLRESARMLCQSDTGAIAPFREAASSLACAAALVEASPAELAPPSRRWTR